MTKFKSDKITLEALAVAGCHFGHQSSKAYPEMLQYIYTQKDGIHVFDLNKTKEALRKVGDYLLDLGSRGGKMLFVGTKRQAVTIVEEEAKRSQSYFVNVRWIGGLLTNWEVIKKNIAAMKKLEENIASGKEMGFTKKEILLFNRKLTKLRKVYGGIETMEKLPDCLFVVDAKKEQLAVREANRQNIPIIAMVDSNSDPEGVDLVIPTNDDTSKAIKLVLEFAAEALNYGYSKSNKKAS